jgi:hypothetical protein
MSSASLAARRQRGRLGPPAQQQPLPVIAFVNAGSREERQDELQGFLKGLGEAGYVEGHNVTIELRWAEGAKNTTQRPPLWSVCDDLACPQHRVHQDRNFRATRINSCEV